MARNTSTGAGLFMLLTYLTPLFLVYVALPTPG